MFGKGKCRTAPVPHGENTPSIKPEKVSEPLEGFIPDNAGRVRISDEVLDSIVNQVEACMLKRSKGKQNAKQPHVRIELDDIADTPKVFIDGALHENVQRIDLSWNKFGERCYQIEMIDDQHKPYGIGQCESK
ncbi:hypothetical protein ACQ7C6_12390 [Lactiplantibacillus plantarum]|uniref:hypothetical protein n=1 Tax=Lactiplantibacillus TaxID=2767842 RepID=UPI002080C271|nr:hypothetical protein [Lactiplantibacillus plantarum]MDO7794987.1 hypothetical protein [Lactiplantibacillus plantarum]GIP78869.1 hypothetical protein ITOLOC_28640 [Lactiplantibacillus plantarum]